MPIARKRKKAEYESGGENSLKLTCGGAASRPCDPGPGRYEADELDAENRESPVIDVSSENTDRSLDRNIIQGESASSE